MSSRRCAGTNTSLATTQLLPEARMPTVYQVSSMVTSARGSRARYWPTKAPCWSCSITPTVTQSACRLPEDQYHLPDTTRPPSTRRVSVDGVNTPATRASGVFPNTSCCAWLGYRQTNQAQTLVSAVTHAVPPHDSARTAVTSRCVHTLLWWPPNRRGTISRNRT